MNEVMQRATARLVQEAIALLEKKKKDEAISLLRVALVHLGGPVEVKLGDN